jgi:ribosomal-protein-alanine N-acetyltransferase
MAAAEGTWRRELPRLHGEGLVLREVEVTDGPTLTEHFRDHDVGRYIPPPPVNLEEFQRFAAWARRQREAGQYLCYAVVPDGGSSAVGIFQVHQMEPPFRTAEWGFVFAKPYWGTGLFARSALPVLAFIFETLGTTRLEARAMVANGRANSVLRKLGASEEGRLRRSFLLGGQYYDDVLWSILDTDWGRRHAEAANGHYGPR